MNMNPIEHSEQITDHNEQGHVTHDDDPMSLI